MLYNVVTGSVILSQDISINKCLKTSSEKSWCLVSSLYWTLPPDSTIQHLLKSCYTFTLIERKGQWQPCHKGQGLDHCVLTNKETHKPDSHKKSCNIT